MEKKRILIAAHMGVIGGNIQGNTYASSDIAIRHNADILELDVTRSMDGELFVFHPDTEKVKLGLDCDIRKMHARDVEKLHLLNIHGTPTNQTIARLRDMLLFLKGRSIINIDKFQDNPAAIAQLVREMKMQDQVIVKTNVAQNLFDLVAEVAYDLPYMPFVYEKDECSEYLRKRRDMRYIGVEAIFSSDASMLANEQYLDMLHAFGKKVWVNAIVFDEKRQLAGGHSDDISICGNPDAGWGCLAKRGYDIIQTDWPLALSQYLRLIGYYGVFPNS